MARLITILLCLLAWASPALPGRITIAVAANFLTTAEDMSAVFSARTGHEVDLVHGSTGMLFAQIVSGAPYDLFLAADQARPARLTENGFAASEYVKPYAIGHLALIHGSTTKPGAPDEILARPGLRVAIADPAVAPYGAAAKEVLRGYRADGWRRDIVLGENSGQAFAFVATGNADAGLVALSHARTYAGELWVMEVPGELHRPILQDAVLLERAVDSAAAQAFYAFLDSDIVAAILQTAGYEVPQ